MQCIVTYANGMYLYLSKISFEIYIFNFGHVSSRQTIYVSKDVRIHGYLSKPKQARKQKKFGKHCYVAIFF
jgi:uncharacterized protein YlbG (UPF0298 family)